jgi:WD40 repeat protein
VHFTIWICSPSAALKAELPFGAWTPPRMSRKILETRQNSRTLLRSNVTDQKRELQLCPLSTQLTPLIPTRFQRTRYDYSQISVDGVQPRCFTNVQDVFSTAGGDGTFVFWDKGRRSRNSEHQPALKWVPAVNPFNAPVTREYISTCRQQSITSGVWNAGGDLYAYALSYDWHKGSEFYDTFKTNKIYVHNMNNEDMNGAPTK